MATTNPELTSAWSSLVTAGDDFLLTLPDTGGIVEIAISDTEESPSVAGHVLIALQGEGLNRTLVGPGYVYGRARETVTVTLTAWTPA
jgi:hypothetical protein